MTTPAATAASAPASAPAQHQPPPGRGKAKPAAPKKLAVDYRYTGRFNHKTFVEAFNKGAWGNPVGANANSDILTLLGMIEADSQITDIRWMAYMLATVLKETTHPPPRERVLDKEGQPVLDKRGQPMWHPIKNWVVTMAPVAEVGRGKGRAYHEPVKVTKLEDGTARVVEQDGDQFSISLAGVIRPAKKTAAMGTTDGGDAVKAYNDDTGTPLSYFGRGYVQLTWWSNYAAAGIALGLGLELLFDPDRVYEPAIAYKIMSHGMRTGFGFANGRTFSKYFSGSSTNYVGARAMVNGRDSAQEIASYAQRFEAALFASRQLPPTAAASTVPANATPSGAPP